MLILDPTYFFQLGLYTDRENSKTVLPIIVVVSIVMVATVVVVVGT